MYIFYSWTVCLQVEFSFISTEDNFWLFKGVAEESELTLVAYLVKTFCLYQLMYVCMFSSRNNPKTKQISIGKKKFNMDPKKVYKYVSMEEFFFQTKCVLFL